MTILIVAGAAVWIVGMLLHHEARQADINRALALVVLEAEARAQDATERNVP